MSAEFVDQHLSAIGESVGPQLRNWGAHGWRIAGVSPRLRVEIVVPRTVQRPRRAIAAIQIGSFRVKPSVIASHVSMRHGPSSNGLNPTASGPAHALAPGARVRVGRGSLQDFIGVAAVLMIDGDAKLLTCGHAEAFQFSDEILAGDEPDGEPIARVERNFLEESVPVDAAICGLTQSGLDLMSASPAPTWRFQTIKAPRAADNGRQVVFWQTHDGEDTALTSPVISFSGSNSALFPIGGPRNGFIETSIRVVEGDSGSLLSLGEELYGLCSGFVANTSFYTPIASVAGRLIQEGKTCRVAPFPGN